MKKIFFTAGLFLFLMVRAEGDGKSNFSVGADLVSSYVWRGSYLAGASIQPAMGLHSGGFSLGGWGSVDFFGGFKEVNLKTGYCFGSLTIGLSDYWRVAEGTYHYFDFSETTDHLLEVNLLFSPQNFPLKFSWNTIIGGNDKYFNDNFEEKRAYSTYIEVIDAFSVKNVKMEIAVGASPWNSSVLYNPLWDGGSTNGFAIVNMSLAATKNVRISDQYSLGIFGKLIFNPAKEDAFFVFGMKF